MPEEDLPGLFAGADAFLYPTLYEGFGLPVVEAMACGTPVLTSSTSALQEIAGGYAYLVDPMDVDAIARGIVDLATDPARRTEFAELGKRRAADFSWDHAAEQTLEVYAEALGGSGLRRHVEPLAARRTLPPPMKTAVVHDWLNGMRGGEKVLEAILPLVPEPTIFTLFHVPGSVSPAIERHPIRASCARTASRSRGATTATTCRSFPRAVESFDLSGFDLVVSSSHCVAKGAIAPPGVAAPLLLPHAGALRVRAVRPLLSAGTHAPARR